MGRVNYATMHALADLNYAINRGVPAATQMHCLSSLFLTLLHFLCEKHQDLVLLGLNFSGCKQHIRGGVLYAVVWRAEEHNGRGRRKGNGSAANGTDASAPGQGASSEEVAGAGDAAGSQLAAPKRERRPKVRTPYTRLVTRARTLVSRIG
jgi:hypothetical protein